MSHSPEDNLRFAVGDNAAGQLIGLVQRIERLEEEKASLSADVREVYAEAKEAGFDVKALRRVLALRKMEPADREKLLGGIETYMGVLEGKA